MTIRLLRVFLSRSDYQGHFQAKIGNAAHIEAFSEHPVGTANWPTRWGNEQAAVLRQTRCGGGDTTRGTPRDCRFSASKTLSGTGRAGGR